MLSAEAKSRTNLHATGVIEQGESGWVLILRLDAESGTLERRLQDASCQVLGEVAALYIALAIDPNAALSSRPAGESPTEKAEVEEVPETPAAAEPEPEPEPEPESESEPSNALPQGPETRYLLGVGAAATLALLPRPTTNLSLLFAVEREWLGFELAAFADLPRAHHYEDPAEAGANFSMAGASVAFCPAFHPGVARVAGCAAVEIGGMSAKGVGVSRAHTERSFWAAADLGTRFTWTPRGPIRLFLRADMVVPLIRPGIGVGGLPELFRVPPVGGRLGLGLAFGLQSAS
jgi:hypothetical protein